MEPTIQSTDTLETIQAKQFVLVSLYTEYASCLNCKHKISDVSVQDLKCPTCNTSQGLSDCEKKINVKVKLAVDSPWLTVFRHVWEDILPNVDGSDNVTNALLNQLNNMTIVVDTFTRIIKEIRRNKPEGNSLMLKRKSWLKLKKQPPTMMTQESLMWKSLDLHPVRKNMEGKKGKKAKK